MQKNELLQKSRRIKKKWNYNNNESKKCDQISNKIFF